MDDKFDQSFAELFQEAGGQKKSRLAPGQKIKATIVSISGDNVFLDIGGKSEGFLAKAELLDKEGRLTVKAGDKVDVFFLSGENNEFLFTTRLGTGSAARAHLEEAYHNGIPVEGFIEKEVNGGFEVKVAGARTFCPYSQIDLKRVDDTAQYIGRHLTFNIIEFSNKGRNIVLSRRQILAEELRLRKAALQESLHEGDIVRGKISSIRDFGAFVSIEDGIEGLLPISEVGWGRISDLHEILSVGQEVDVVAMKLDWQNDRFSFSLKEALPDPWEQINNFPEGSCHQGQVAKLLNFGAFVSLRPGLEGLVHISKLGHGRRLHHPREELAEGQSIMVRVEKIDHENRRISLDHVAAAEEESDHLHSYRSAAGPEKPSGLLGNLLAARLEEKKRKK